MAESHRDIARVLLQVTTAEWLSTLGLVFGGCCSNAWALELATAQNPHAGTLITFAQFLLVSLHGLRAHLVVESARGAVLRRVADGVLALRARTGRAAMPLYVAVTGPLEEAMHFADAAAGVLLESTSAQGVGVARIGGAQLAAQGEADLAAAHLRAAKAPGDSVVFVGGADLQQRRWDYTVRLVHALRADSPAPPRALLTVDITSSTAPVIVRPAGHILPRRVLNALARVRLRPRAIPLSRWAVQVALFLLTSLMNNAAFAYAVPMAVHIIFRSGGLVVNMLIGYLVGGRRYTARQVVSVVLVTLGVACTTLSAAPPADPAHAPAGGSYAVGILLLTVALVLSGLMGLAQDRAYEQYGRGHYQEAMFYLHALALPGFALLARPLAAQVRFSARTPAFSAPLLLNVATQLVCISGVHRLTSRVNSLTVTLVLVVRKAVSLGISVVVLGRGEGEGVWLWGGAALVLVGTVGYTVGGSPAPAGVKVKEREKDPVKEG